MEEEVYLSVSFYKISRIQADALLDKIRDALVEVPREVFGEMHIHIGEPIMDDEEDVT